MVRKFRFFIYCLTLVRILTLTTAPIFAQHPPVRTLAELKARLESEMQRQHIAGMMLSIATKDSVVFAGGLGYADLKTRMPVTANHLFRGSSVTKLFLALGILNLIYEGKLTADTKLQSLAPEIPFKNKWEATHPVTIGGLMEHTTGFSDKSPFEEYNFSGKPYPGTAALKVFEKFAVSRWKPGEKHAYSNVNYSILAYVIEKVSGKPLGIYLQESVFKPLHMPDANVSLTADGSGKYCKGYVWKENNFQEVPHQPAFNAGYSSLNLGAADCASALKAYLNDWKTASGPFLTPEILKDSEMPHTYLSAKAGLKNTYAYGNEAVDLNGQIFRGHRGAIGGFLSAFLYNRTLGLGYAFAVNTHDEAFYRFADQLISQFVLKDTGSPARVKTYPVNKKAVVPYAGYYRLSNPGQLYSGFFESLTNTINVKIAGEKLEVAILGRGKMRWEAVDTTGLRYKDERAANPQILFLQDSDHNPLIMDGTLVFEKTNALGAWLPIILFLFSLLMIVSSLFFGLYNLIFFAIKSKPGGRLGYRLVYSLPALGFLLVVWSAAQLWNHMREAAPMEQLFLLWSGGKWLFALGTLLTIALLIRQWSRWQGMALKIYLTLVTFSCCYLLILVYSNHWY